MLNRLLMKSLRTFLILSAALAGIFLTARFVIECYALPRIHTSANSPGARVAIVFGAGLSRDGRPSPVLRDRVTTAADLYFQGKVEKILMSGDNRFEYYNEPGAMRKYALELGVPDSSIVLDFAGRRTYDTCYRASAIFGVKEAVLVTQRFHLARALFTCNLLGLPATGANADRRTYSRSSRLIWNGREIFASMVAMWEVLVTHPEPVLGNPEPIFPEEKTTIPTFTGENSP
jgi:SanA protein